MTYVGQHRYNEDIRQIVYNPHSGEIIAVGRTLSHDESFAAIATPETYPFDVDPSVDLTTFDARMYARLDR